MQEVKREAPGCCLLGAPAHCGPTVPRSIQSYDNGITHDVPPPQSGLRVQPFLVSSIGAALTQTHGPNGTSRGTCGALRCRGPGRARPGATGRGVLGTALRMPDVRIGAGKDDRHLVGVRPEHVVGRSPVLMVQSDDFPVTPNAAGGRALDHELIPDVCLHGSHSLAHACAVLRPCHGVGHASRRRRVREGEA